MEHAPRPKHDHATSAARAPGGGVIGVRLNVGQPPSGLVPLATLGIAAGAVGWGATSLLVALVNARSMSASALGYFLTALVVAVTLRLLFMQTWRARRANRRLRLDTRRRLDAVLGAGVAPDVLTLCWCIAVAAGCSNRDARPLTLALLEEVEARLRIRLPRYWYFDGRGAMAEPAGPRADADGRYRVARPCPTRRIVTEALTAVIILGIIPLSLAIAITSAGQGGPQSNPQPGVHPGVVLTLMAVGVTAVMVLRSWAARREWRVICEREGELSLQLGRDGAPSIPLGPDAFAIAFTRTDERLRSFRLERSSVPPDRRLRLLGHAPWRTVEISLTRQRPTLLGLEL